MLQTSLPFLEDWAWPLLLWGGLAAYVASNWLLMLFRKLNATRYLPRAYWSCFVTGGASTPALVLGGLVRMLFMCTVFPFAYAWIFSRIGRAEVLPGTLVGLAHGLLAGLLLPLAARRCAGARPPGLMGWNLGRATPFILLAVHAAYGALLGYVYVLASAAS